MRRPRTRLAIVGAGKLARAFARALAGDRGYTVTIAARNPARAAAVARSAPGLRFEARIARAVADADVVLLAVPDAAIAPASRTLAATRTSWRGAVALHAAGALGPAPLAALARRGASTGVLHPLAVLGASRSSTLAGAAARLEGAPRARAAARRLARAAGLRPLAAPGLATPGGRSAYHAAASLASNDVLALLAAAQALLVRRGVTERQANRALERLAAGMLAQFRHGGVAAALTGPAARGDAATLHAHFRVLDAAAPDAAEAHRALSRILLSAADAAGGLRPEAVAALGRALGRGRGRRRTV